MIRLFKSQVIRNPNNKALHLLTAAQKHKKLLVLLFIINVSTIGFGDAELTNFMSTLRVINETRIPFDFNKKISTFARHNTEIEERIIKNYNLTRTAITEYSQDIQRLKKENADLKKEVINMQKSIDQVREEAKNALSNQMEKMQERINQIESSSSQKARSISTTDQELQDVKQRTRMLEGANKALENKFTEFMTTGTGKLIWKLEEYKSKIEKQPYNKDVYSIYVNGPSFYTHQFGYKMEVCLNVRREDNRIWIDLGLLRGEYDNIVKWPFNENVTFTFFDQSEKANHFVKNFQSLPGTVNVCYHSYHPPVSFTSSSCRYPTMLYEEFKNREFVKNDTLYLGVKVQTSIIEL